MCLGNLSAQPIQQLIFSQHKMREAESSLIIRVPWGGEGLRWF